MWSVLCVQLPPLPGYGHLCVSVWRFHGAPGAEGSDCHPVSQALGFCFVLGLLLGANHRVQIRDSKKKIDYKICDMCDHEGT